MQPRRHKQGTHVGKLLEEIKALIWTLAGTGLVLICLAGRTLKMGLWITGIALVLHLVLALTTNEEP